MRSFCDTCDRDHELIIQSKTESFTQHGKTFDVEIVIATCGNCGDEVHVTQLFDDNLKKIRETYNNLYGGLTVEEIRQVRSQYPGLGKRPFAKLLNIGVSSVGRYESESGATMSSDNLAIYCALKNDPDKIVDYYNLNKHVLSKRELNQVEAILNSFANRNQQFIIPDEEIIEKLYKSYAHTSLSGYRAFDFDKFVNMILYFTRNGVNKTKLMKLLWFADFFHFKRQTVSISGAVYNRLPFGPVPKDHDILFAHLQHMGIIKVDEHEHDEGWIRMEVKAGQDYDPNLFDGEEWSILERVNTTFESFGSRKISDYSHDERAWIETDNEQSIDYTFAMDLREI